MAAPVQLITPRRFADERGWFAEVASDARLAELGITDRFVQENHSLSRAPFTLRGLHYQAPPHAQAKLVRCVRGRVLDVAVDLRTGSPTFGRWTSAELSADNGRLMYVATGFAHGFLTLEADCEIVYRVSAGYAPAADCAIRWDDPVIGVDWSLPPGTMPALSAKDRDAPLLSAGDAGFAYDGEPMPQIAG